MTDSDLIPGSLLSGLRQDLIDRRIQSGIDRLEQHAELIASFDPRSCDGPKLLWRLAQWADVGWRNSDVVSSVLQRLPAPARGTLPLCDYAAVRMSEGMLAMSHEDVDEAAAHFSAVLLLATDIDDHELVAIAHFWKARCLRKRGEYEAAMAHTVLARTTALQCGCERMAAVMRTLESWLLFQKGRHKESLRVLAATEALLRDTDDYVTLGNIQSTYGRIYRQEGRYDSAISHFRKAVEFYRTAAPQHVNLARTLANVAYVERVVALELRRKVEEDVQRHRNGRSGPSVSPATPLAHYRDEFERVRDMAFAHLDEATLIYEAHLNYRGSGTVHLNRGLLHLDNGALDLAEEEANAAWALGEQKEDLILMARARLLQCMVENSKVEEGIGEDPRRHAQAALECIREALDYAHKTQNRRLLARVHTWHGLTLSNEFFRDNKGAAEAASTATSYLDQSFHDTAWEDLATLKARVSRNQSVDETLLAWSQGSVGNRSFGEIEEQFAAIVIPRVWELEGRKIARVAARLSVSPKKIRRALRHAGISAAARAAEAASGSPE